MANTALVPVNIPLKERFWVYRDKVLHERKNAAEFDRIYWQTRPKPPAPTLTSLNPNTAPGGADVIIHIIGTGFDPGVKALVDITEVAPTSTPTASDFNILIPGAEIPPGKPSAPISVKNGDGQISNAIKFSIATATVNLNAN